MSSTSESLAAWKAAALADGWSEKPGGPWGRQSQPLELDHEFGGYKQTGERSAGDNSSLLRRGDAVVHLVDRRVFNFPEAHASGWFSNGLSAWAYFPEVYDPEEIEALRGICPVCREDGDPERLVHLMYASVACPGCIQPPTFPTT